MSQAFDDLVKVVARLRAPDGCPWDRKQTHDSLKPYLLEESYEVLDALDQKKPSTLCEELGDLLLQILLHAQLEAEQGTFTIHEVMTVLTQKLIRRHPHVFAPSKEGESPLNADQVTMRWDHIKKEERADKGEDVSILDGVPSTLPALLRAAQIQSRASRVGFDWEHPSQVINKLDEELNELRQAAAAGKSSPPIPSGPEDSEMPNDLVEQEFGDVLFTVANLARFLNIKPEDALRKATNRFIARFHYVEQRTRDASRELTELTNAEWDNWWEEAKSQEHLKPSDPIDPLPSPKVEQ